LENQPGLPPLPLQNCGSLPFCPEAQRFCQKAQHYKSLKTILLTAKKISVSFQTDITLRPIA
jgi:hypothetical protein